MLYWGELSSVLCALFWAVALVLFRISVTKIPALPLALFKNAVALNLLFLTWLIVRDQDTGLTLASRDILILFFSGIIGISAGDTLFLHSLKILGAGRNAILACLFSPFVIALSFVFLSERIKPLQLIGIVAILAGILLAIYKAEDNLSTKELMKGTLVGIAAIFFMAVGMETTKPFLDSASPIEVSCIRIFGGLMGILLFLAFSGQLNKSFQHFSGRLPWKVMFLGTVMGGYLAQIAWIIGFKYTSVSIASILNQTSVFFALILATLFLKEKLTPLKIAGSILGFSGVAIILIHA